MKLEALGKYQSHDYFYILFFQAGNFYFWALSWILYIANYSEKDILYCNVNIGYGKNKLDTNKEYYLNLK
jgi:hypothetical protein